MPSKRKTTKTAARRPRAKASPRSRTSKPSPRSRPAKAAKSSRSSAQRRRLWLMYPPRMITIPVIWELSQKFKVIPNVRQASVTDEIGIVCLELRGTGIDISSAIKWLEKIGINVEPVEINVIES